MVQSKVLSFEAVKCTSQKTTALKEDKRPYRYFFFFFCSPALASVCFSVQRGSSSINRCSFEFEEGEEVFIFTLLNRTQEKLQHL